VQPLGLAGIPVAIMAQARNVVRQSRHVGAELRWADPATNPVGFVDRVLEFAEAQVDPPVLYVCGDWDLLAASRQRERLTGRLRFLMAPAELVENLVDKTRFPAYAERMRLPVPRAVCLSVGDEGVPQLDLRFPIVIKPATRFDGSWTELTDAKAIRVATAEAFAALWPRLVASRLDLIAQELVPGPETRIESYHVYVDATGAVVAEFTGRKIRTYPPRLGHSTAVEITDAPDVREIGRRCVQSMALVGVAKLDFKRAPDGSLYLLEVNPRFSLWHRPGAAAGVNIPAVYYADLVGVRRPPTSKARAGVAWCDPVTDMRAAAASGVPAHRWLAWLPTLEAPRFTLDDPSPWLAGAFKRVGRPFAPIARRVRRRRPHVRG
jgi:predicted ATP-grasp superfamily ATP-dependent carboligase